ncbi:Transcriptional regulator containing PAS, AAA-type ATPase, and DNA-binding Fis domains [Enterococcus malodoratus]|uniref:sigma-54 interaction domain-containing protein n=1 Tax=Enterococcus malodoratus TaxID=71451 RepID=UPI0008B4A36D|nr:sigma 54-interacting transcriptional regulator [Enterococcus malodoratus]SET10129.1 Transcriptional regulator containing PAS, AAA-type ATPase, and DNA-binding Fis domains [Enterococcus malodoratus]
MSQTLTKLMTDDITTLFVTDRDGNILLANDFTAMTLGITLNELLNSNVYDLVASEIYDTSATIETLKSEKNSEVTLTTQAGYHIQSKSTPIFYPDGTMHLVVTKSEPLTQEEFEELSSNERTQPEKVEEQVEIATSVIAESNEMKKIIRVCKQVASYNSRILLLGESGVGKEVIANFIHRHSQVADDKFVAVNCAAIPESLFESEFFGYEKGTFTGAEKSKPGLIENADGGTLFLDEISEMPLELQAKLLRVLETMTVRRVGGMNEMPVAFRLISASNQNMFELVEQGKFRRDLYYRINAIPVTIPPLRKSKKDILALANYFLDSFNQKYEANVTLSKQHLHHLMSSDWLGNARELKNYIEYVVVTAELPILLQESLVDESIGESDELQALADVYDYPDFIDYVEKIYFQQNLQKNQWNISKTAEDSNVSRPFVYKKIRELELERNDTV